MKLYNDYNSYLKTKYGCKVYRIGLDAGLSCPNRDGKNGLEGCLYCNEDGSRSIYTNAGTDISEQLRSRIAYLKKKVSDGKFIAYFQAFTNTHASVEKLKTIYDKILPFDDIVGISIGTRPDAIDREKIFLISSYKNRYEVWMEYGLQSASNKTLALIKRGHTYEDFRKAVKLTKESGMPVCAHVILGLPGETKKEMLNTANAIAGLNIDGVKIHVLHVLKGSRLEQMYNNKKITLLEEDEYAEIVCDFIELLPKHIIIQRLTGQGSPKNHIAPAWATDKTGTIKKIEDTLKRRKTYQGYRLEGTPTIS